jgi:hypothetical protein
MKNVSDLTQENYDVSLIIILEQITVLAKGNTLDDG